MPIEVHLIPPGAPNARAEIIARAADGLKRPDFSGLTAVTPTHHVRRAFGEAFHAHAGGTYIPPEMLTIRQLARRTVSRLSGKVIVPGALRPSIIAGLAGTGSAGLSAMVAEMISELTLLMPLATVDQIRDRIERLFADAGVHEEAAARARRAMDVFAAYRAALDRMDAVDDDGLFSLAASIWTDRLRCESLVLDGFYEVAEAEGMLMSALIEKAGRAFVIVPISGPDDKLEHCHAMALCERYGIKPVLHKGSPRESATELYAAPSAEAEIEDAARHIKAMHLAGASRDLEHTFIVYPSPEPSMRSIVRVMKRYGVPLDEASAAGALSEYPAFSDLIALIETVCEGFPAISFTRVLHSPHFAHMPAALREVSAKLSLNAALPPGEAGWRRTLGAMGCGSDGEKLFEMLRPLSDRRDGASCHEHAMALMGVSQALGFGAGDERAELARIAGSLTLIDDALGVPVTLSTFLDAFASVLRAAGGERETEGVRVASLFDVRGIEPARLYLCGLRDGDLPSRQDMDFILPDRVRRMLGLVDMARYLKLQERIFRRLAESAGHVSMSYPAMEGDKIYLPSMLVREAPARGPLTGGIYSDIELMAGNPNPYARPLFMEIPQLKLYSNESVLNVTDIDAYRACPRLFFMERMLGLEPPERTDYEIDPRVLGTIVHRAMEGLLKAGHVTGDAIRENVTGILDKAMAGMGLDRRLQAIVRETFIQMAPRIALIEEELRSAGFRFSEAERKVTGEPLPGIRMKGKVDRIDMGADGRAAVLDYKTGEAGVSGVGVLERGEGLQLFIYAAVLRAQGIDPVRVGTYSLKNFEIKWFPMKTDARKRVTIDDYTSAALRYMEESVARMRAGDFKAAPANDGKCARCAEAPYCPHAQRAGA